MHINIFAIIATLVGSLFITTKMRHPHIKAIRQSLEGSTISRLIDTLDFYTGNHVLFYDEMFPESSRRDETPKPSRTPDPFKCFESPTCLFPRPHGNQDIPSNNARADPYRMSPFLWATIGFFFFLVAGRYFRHRRPFLSGFGLGDVTIIDTRNEETKLGDIATIFSLPVQGQNDIDPPPYVSVVTRNNDTIFYSDTDTIEVAPPIPKAVSKPLVRMEAFQRSPSVSSESRAVQTSPVTDASILGIMLSRTSSSRSSTMDLLETSFPFSNEDDDEPPCSTPPTQDIPSLNVEEEAPDSEPALPAEFDITVLWRLSNLPFAQDIEEEPPSTPLSRPEHSIGRDSPLPVEVFAEPNFTAPLTSTLSFPEDPHSNLGNLGVHPEEEALMEDLQVTESVAPQISTPSCDLKSRQDLQEVSLREVSFQNDAEAEDEPSSRMEGPVVPLDVSASTSVFASSGKIQLPRARPTTSLARPMTVSGDIHSWNIEPQHGEGVVSFAFGRSDADLAHAISTSLPRVIDLGGTGMIEDEGRSREGEQESQLEGLSSAGPIAGVVASIGLALGSRGVFTEEYEARHQANGTATSPTASQILRRVAHAVEACPRTGTSVSGANGGKSASSGSVTSTEGTCRDNMSLLQPEAASETTSAPPSVRNVVMRRILGPQQLDGSEIQLDGFSLSTQRPPMRITRIFGHGEPEA